MYKNKILYHDLGKAIVFLFVLFLVSACVSFYENPEAVGKGVYTIRAYTLDEKNEKYGYKIPKTAMNKGRNKKFGSVVKSQNVEGYKTYKVVCVDVNKTSLKYVYVTAQDSAKTQMLQEGDQILDDMTETLLMLIEKDKESIINAFQNHKEE